MNRIYKVIWSKVKHQYVVVSELAHSCTKSTTSRIGKSAASVLAAFVLTIGVCGLSVQAADGDSHVTGTQYVDGYQTVGKNQTVNGSQTIGGNQTVGGTQTVKGQSHITDSQTVGGYQTVEKNQTVNGSQIIGGDQRVGGKVTASAANLGGFQFQDGKMMAEDGAEVSLEDIKNASELSGELQENIEHAQTDADTAISKAEHAQADVNTAIDHIGYDHEKDQYKDITVTDKNGNTFNNLTDALNYTKDIVGDGNLTNGGSTLTEGININSAAIAQNRQDINNLNHRVDNLDSRIDKVGAGAAALAALHPLDFDPDAKWDFAAGYGNYGGENAVAVGTFYRPNEDTMFSVGGTFGNGENMINAGVSLKIGAGSSHVTTSRTAMAKEIKSMRDVVAKQDAQIQKLTAMVNALVGVQTETDTTTMFPDVPENHWAYEAVEAMAKSGLVKGYPDGEFKGDRNMTRYEFAQIVYNAIQAGAEVDARLVEEFKPELQFFHIATVAKDKDGNPTIERVRAN